MKAKLLCEAVVISGRIVHVRGTMLLPWRISW